MCVHLTPLVFAQRFHPTNAALLALLFGDGPTQPPSLACDHCGTTAEEAAGLKVCRDCLPVRYCGKECQLAAWPGHKMACNAQAKEREKMTRVTEVEPPASTS